jgi:hypothetical protein
MDHKASGSVWLTTLITLALIAAFLVFAVTKLPRGYSNDLSRIGAGSNIAVLVHDKGAVQSLDLMALIDSVRSDYSGAAQFLMVDVAGEKGKTFSREQNISGVALAFFGPDGKRLDVRYDIRDEAGLRSALDKAFGP